MTKGLPRSLAHAELDHLIEFPEPRVMRGRAQTFNNSVAATSGVSGDGRLTFILGAVPRGNILILASVAELSITGPGSAQLAEAWEGDAAIGTLGIGAGGIALGSHRNITDSTPLTAVSEDITDQRMSGDTPVLINNSDGNTNFHFNLDIDTADLNANQSVALDITLILFYTYIQVEG